MPHNSLLSCFIEIGEAHSRLREHGTNYRDRTCETYVAIPSRPTPFSIHLFNDSYIAPGLSVYVWIDGVYQTNRNKRSATAEKPKLEFRLGNKENLLKDGQAIAQGWWFDKLNIVNGKTKPTISEKVLKNLGVIEVVVLRCEDDPDSIELDPWSFPMLPSLQPKQGNSSSSTRRKSDRLSKKQIKKAKEPSEAGDGGGDFFGCMFGGDGASDEPPSRSMHPFGLDGYYDTDRWAHSHAREWTGDQRSYYRDDRHDQATRTSSEDDEEKMRPRKGWTKAEEAEMRQAVAGAVADGLRSSREDRVHFTSPTRYYSTREERYRERPRQSTHYRDDRDPERKSLEMIRTLKSEIPAPSPASPYDRKEKPRRDHRHQSDRHERRLRSPSTPSRRESLPAQFYYRGGSSSDEEYSEDSDSTTRGRRRTKGKTKRQPKVRFKRSKPEPEYATVKVPSPYDQAQARAHRHEPSPAYHDQRNSSQSTTQQQHNSRPSPKWTGYAPVHAPAQHAHQQMLQPQMPGAWPEEVHYQPVQQLPPPQMQPPQHVYPPLGYHNYQGHRHPVPLPTIPARMPAFNGHYPHATRTAQKIADLEEKMRRLKAGYEHDSRSHQLKGPYGPPRLFHPPPFYFHEAPFGHPREGYRDRKKKGRSRSSSPGWEISSSSSGSKSQAKEGGDNGWGAKTDTNNQSGGWGEANQNNDTSNDANDEKKDDGWGGNNGDQSNNTQQDWGNPAPDSGNAGDNGTSDWNNTGGNDSNSWNNGGQQSNNDDGSNKSQKSMDQGNGNGNGQGDGGWEGENSNNTGGWGGQTEDQSKNTESNSKKKDKKEKKSSSKKKRRDSDTSSSSEEEKPYTRSYWKQASNGGPQAGANSNRKRGEPIIEEDHVYTISKEDAEERNLKHQVRVGKAVQRQTKTGSSKPLYWDNFDAPYAVFRFHYRSRDMLEKKLGTEVKESKGEYKEWLSALSKEQLVAEMLRNKQKEDSDGDASAKKSETKKGGDAGGWNAGGGTGPSGGWDTSGNNAGGSGGGNGGGDWANGDNAAPTFATW